MAPIQFGILMIPYQMLDVAGPIDLLSTSSKTLIEHYAAAGFPGMAGLPEKAIDIQFHHINTTMDPVLMSANINLVPTTTVDACPPLDYLLIGGPDPLTFKLDEKFAEFIRKHVESGKGVFTTCTGGLAISSSGVLDGRKATTNHQALEMARQMRPQVNWVKEQWVEDGQFWTAGGACAGMDMFSHWVAKHYAPEVAAVGLDGLDFEPRDIEGKRALRAEQVV
ncbi:hypothetical protein ONS95_002062 [Cadophora gregata]|uniref:uncharacterized protein n=1 Tax=Cadophora gregata TaxID=51156 RepID=UPI0026DAFCA1|nr:uncharacterized protein ONS95_002062 [Cadophora gregata]KAK0111721.1 hypothetical protein ONS95_002062 [Cadophora gregata]KAK0111802.1 hypothetical protein ONS96_001070 [Cadophora gregata f. sp. sojae]